MNITSNIEKIESDSDYNDNNDNDNDNDNDYFSSIVAREEELRKINQELDLKLDKVVGNATCSSVNNVDANQTKEGRASCRKEDKDTNDPAAANDADGDDDDDGGGDNDDDDNDNDDDELNRLMSIENIMSSFSINDTNDNSNNKKGSNKPSTKRQNNLPVEQNNNGDDYDYDDDYDEMDGLFTAFEFDQETNDDANATRTRTATSRNNKSFSKSAKKIKKIKNIKNNSTTCTNTATQHLQNVQIKALSTNLKNAIESKSNLSKSNAQLQTKLSKIEETNRKLSSQLSRLQTQMTKKDAECRYNQNTMDDLRSENCNLKKEVNNLRSIVKGCESDSRSNEMRLKRALESVEKFKSVIMDYKQRSEGDESSLRKIKKDYEMKLKQLKKQRDDLLVGFKKQAQLINVLKRIKVHLEASRLLDFTEQEFMKVLDWECHSDSKKIPP